MPPIDSNMGTETTRIIINANFSCVLYRPTCSVGNAKNKREKENKKMRTGTSEKSKRLAFPAVSVVAPANNKREESERDNTLHVRG